ncbi:MAG: succinate dehydrogenase cytochrome b subunit [Planctomycetes bacterium]|nr:succinate dehydrogenase cytochrome b subunit [Planctomycetota bacterium]
MSSTIGQKIVMALTGLALCGFLLVHLGGNLLLYVGEQKYNDYAHALHAQGALLLVAEIGLFAMFVIHIGLAFRTSFANAAARPIAYAMRQSKQDPGPLAQPPSGVMLATGIVVLVFLLVHLSDFKFFSVTRATGLRHQSVPADAAPFARAVGVLQDPISALVYFAGSLVLAYHVLHGFASAFQTLGLRHPKYTPLVKTLSLVFAIVVGVGFASFPFWAWTFR